MNHRSQIFTRNRLQDPLFSRGEAVETDPPDFQQTGHTWANTNMQSATSLALLLLLLLLPPNTFPAHIATSARQLLPIFFPLLLLLWGYLSLSIFPPCFSICQSQQLWCWIINSKPEAPPITPGRGRRAGGRAGWKGGEADPVRKITLIYVKMYLISSCPICAIYMMYITHLKFKFSFTFWDFLDIFLLISFKLLFHCGINIMHFFLLSFNWCTVRFFP